METEEANARAKNKEAILTAGMGYGKRKRESLAAFWSIVWPRLEIIGWKRVNGSGNDEGAMTFFGGVAFTKSGKQFPMQYDKIKSVLDRLEESADKDEAEIFEAFREIVPIVEPQPLPISRPKRGTRRPRLSVSRPVEDESEIDTSWKDGGSLYPKKSSEVGPRHQVSFLPPAGSVDTEKKSEEPQ